MTATIYAGERPKPSSEPVVLKADRMVDVVERSLVEPGVVVVEGERIATWGPSASPTTREVIELGDVTLLPGLMDMELNFVMGGAGSTHMSAVQDDPAMKLLRADSGVSQDVARRVHDRAQPRDLRADRRPPARRVAHARRSTRDGSPGRASSRRATPSRRPAGTSTPRCSRASRPA